MRTRGDKRPSRKHDRKVLVAEESTKSWADIDSESSSSSSSSRDSEQEEVHCLMADQTSDDEVFDFSNIEFTREDLVSALNDMVKEYRKLSHSFEEVKAENISLKSSSTESSSDELEDIDSLKIELRKLTAENDLLRNDPYCSPLISSGDSRRFRPPFWTFEVALDSSRRAILIDTLLGGCCCLERDREVVVFGRVLRVEGAQSSQSAHQPQQQQHEQQVAQQSGRQRFRPRGHLFKKKSGSGSSGSGSSSSSGSRAEFCGFYGEKYPSTQCVVVQGSCNLCGQYGNFARVCPSAGSQQTTAQPQGRGRQLGVVPLSFSSLVHHGLDSRLSLSSLDPSMLSLRLISCNLRLVLLEGYRPDLMTSAMQRRFIKLERKVLMQRLVSSFECYTIQLLDLRTIRWL
ncbi:hypothetical protein F511_12580 [Dorcoceras hygrometricum]|uniref:CCHC-type domain-containing protein n=1 Tax=Dorcoceras hygrometricum TaxID=472368 RepID=A0A2Z7AER5_9LAMI|nr:hypothetical protein F511_12580 [Dorcoceras hygrometricum]